MLLTMSGARLGLAANIERMRNIKQDRLGCAIAELPISLGIFTAVMEAVVIELETPIDRVLAPKPAANGKVVERAELLAKGDFRDPADLDLDRPSARQAAHRRLIGRAG